MDTKGWFLEKQVCYGVVWCGVVWCGVVWCGVVRSLVIQPYVRGVWLCCVRAGFLAGIEPAINLMDQ